MKKENNIQNYFFRMLINGKHTFSEEQLLKIDEHLQTKIAGNGCFCTIIHMESEVDAFGIEEQLQLLDVCRSMIKKLGFLAYCDLDSNLDVVMLILECGANETAAIGNFYHMLSRKTFFPIKIGIGRRYQKLTQASSSWYEAYEALLSINDTMGIADFRDIWPTEKQFEFALLEEQEEVIRRLKYGDLEEIETELARFAELVRMNAVEGVDATSPINLRRAMIELVINAMHIVLDGGLDAESMVRYAGLYKEIFGLYDAEAIIKWMNDFLRMLSEIIIKQQHDCVKTVSEEIRDFINSHLSDIELSIASVSELFKMSPGYFSAFFIKKNGIGFKAYVTQQRVALAKKLLLETDDSISIISDKCGFLTPSYFISVFKKQTGKTPGIYRKMKN